jgi:hypothetical protein
LRVQVARMMGFEYVQAIVNKLNEGFPHLRIFMASCSTKYYQSDEEVGEIDFIIQVKRS